MIKTDDSKLRNKMAEKGLSCNKAAEILGIDRATFYRRMQKNDLRISDIKKLSDVLQLSGEEAADIFLVG